MAPRDKKPSKVVVVRAPEEEHEGGHGGSWKVAYADFVTAMMAFFLLLWLLAMLEPDKRDRLADFFVEYSLMQVMKGSPGFADAPIRSKDVAMKPGKPLGGQRAFPMPQVEAATTDEIRSLIGASIESQLLDLKDQVLVEPDSGGVRIEIVDKEGRPMFVKGSSEPTELGKRVLKVLAQTLAAYPNKLTITGHTDAEPYSDAKRLSNWELSTFRALATRRELETWGVGPDHLERISGAASSEPLIARNPRDPRNRRVSIRVLEAQVPADSNIKPSSIPNRVGEEGVAPQP